MRQFLLTLASAIAFVVLLPFWLWSMLPLPEYSAFTAPSQLLSFIPGFTGILLRRVWYRLTLKKCGTNLTVDWLAVIRLRDTEIGDRCTLGVQNWVGWAKIGNDVLTGSQVTIVSGAHQHGFNDLTRPMREQEGEKRQIVLGDDLWIGAQSVIMTDVAPGTVIGAGAIVTRTFPDRSVLVGNPARPMRQRGS